MALLLGLPREMQTSTASLSTDPAGLVSLASTCRELRTPAFENKYRGVAIRETDHLEPVFAVLSPSNEGLKCIRHLRICLDNSSC